MSAPEETVTVVDPRHPLFGRTLPCLGIANSSHRGRCCIVWIRPTVERHVPIAATNLEYDPTTLYPLPISVSTLQQFLQEYLLVTDSKKGESADDAETKAGPSNAGGSNGSRDPAPSRLDDVDRRATSNRAPGARHDVPAMFAQPKGGQR